MSAKALFAGALGAFTVLSCSDEVRVPAASGGGGAGAGGSPPVATACPEVAGTWPMVAVPKPDGSFFCIDSREVTNEQYATFLAESPAVPELHPECAIDDDHTPNLNWPPGAGRERLPVTAVTWCDAQAFCLARGKRLCGDANGELFEFDNTFDTDQYSTDPFAAELAMACTRNGERMFAYGNEPEIGRCNEIPDTGPELVAADAESTCEGGYGGIFFLTGNAWEWEATCSFIKSGEGLGNYVCVARGRNSCAAFGVSGYESFAGGPHDWMRELGFRCCADALPADG